MSSEERSVCETAILIIDDEPDQHTALVENLKSRFSVGAKSLHPSDVMLEDLQESHLVLVDFLLEDWPSREELESLALKPADGLALTTLLRRQISARAWEDIPPTAFALFTGKLDKLAAPLPPEHREHTLAAMNNLEWVFRKEQDGTDGNLSEQIVELAKAVGALPESWQGSSENGALERLEQLLGLAKDESLREARLEEIERAQPPIHELSEWSHGLAVLRWLLHRVLPYPCFLWDEYQLASRLRIEPAALKMALKTGSALRDALGDAEYKGILANFVGPRWWRPDVEAILWQRTEGKSFDLDQVRKLIREMAQQELPASEPEDHPVVCLDANYRPCQLSSIQKSVRIQPDDWPSFADHAWVTVEMAKEIRTLKGQIVLDDVERVT